jgi:hypothetical protein
VALRTPPPKPTIKLPTKGNLKESVPSAHGEYLDNLHPELTRLTRAIDSLYDFNHQQTAGFAQDEEAVRDLGQFILASQIFGK